MLETLLNDLKVAHTSIKKDWKQTSFGNIVYYASMAGIGTFLACVALSENFSSGKQIYQAVSQELDKIPSHAYRVLFNP
ncbi:MAG: hypothetical protein AABX07_02770 [Nanoarchaeota archaeon]